MELPAAEAHRLLEAELAHARRDLGVGLAAADDAEERVAAAVRRASGAIASTSDRTPFSTFTLPT